METFIVGLVIILILGAAIWYIAKAKKSGKKCIGCPDGGSCHSCSSCASAQNGGTCGCDHEKTE